MKPIQPNHLHRRRGLEFMGVISALVVPLSWALAQGPAAPAAAPRAVPAGSVGAQPGALMNGGAANSVPNGLPNTSGNGTSSGMTNGALEGSQNTHQNIPPGFVPPVNNVQPMPNPQIQFPGEVQPSQTAPGSGLSGSNNSVNTSPFTPSLQGSGSLGASPQIGTGSPPLGTNGSTTYSPSINQ